MGSWAHSSSSGNFTTLHCTSGVVVVFQMDAATCLLRQKSRLAGLQSKLLHVQQPRVFRGCIMHARKKRGLTSKASYVRLVISSSRRPLCWCFLISSCPRWTASVPTRCSPGTTDKGREIKSCPIGRLGSLAIPLAACSRGAVPLPRSFPPNCSSLHFTPPVVTGEGRKGATDETKRARAAPAGGKRERKNTRNKAYFYTQKKGTRSPLVRCHGVAWRGAKSALPCDLQERANCQHGPKKKRTIFLGMFTKKIGGAMA